MEGVQAPLWYLFAGQEYGNVMGAPRAQPLAPGHGPLTTVLRATSPADFDSEPWDMTCEAAGIGTADSGKDFAQALH